MFQHRKPAAVPSDKLGLYIHIPFCRSKCDYCDFYSLAGERTQMDNYQKALLTHLKETASLTRGIPVDTIYFGGGTPSFYGEKRLVALLTAIKKWFSVESNAEITLEANPDSVNEALLKHLHKAGFNRISLGYQSAHPEELLSVHRPHTVEQADTAVALARKAGFKNLSLDLIYGLPTQTLESWQATVEHVLSLDPEHLSCYSLNVEEGTPLAARVANGESLPNDDVQADCYLWTVNRLAQAGLSQYEISNFAKPGRASRHNLRYWMMRPYLGFGPGAHSDFGSRRFSFLRDLSGYIDGVLQGGRLLDEDDLISSRERGGEYLMLRLRTVHGIEEWEYRRSFCQDFSPLETSLENFASHGWAVKTPEGRWHFTPQGFLISNQLIGTLLQQQEATTLEELLPRSKARFIRSSLE